MAFHTLVFTFLISIISGLANVHAAENFLGTRSLYLEGGYWLSEWMEFSVPPGLESFQLIVKGSPEQMVQITDLISPGGKSFVSSGAGKGQLSSRHYPLESNLRSFHRSVAVMPGTGSLIVPQHPRLLPEPGIWKMRSITYLEPKSKEVEFHLVTRVRGDESRRLNIHLWVDPRSEWAERASELSLIQQTAQNLLKMAGIDLVFQGQAPMQIQLPAALDIPKRLDELTTAHHIEGLVNVYLMRPMLYQGPGVNGIACLGGPVSSSFRHTCGVALFSNDSMKMLTATKRGQILAHELAHYLGLFHTDMSDLLDPAHSRVPGDNMMDPGQRSLEAEFSPLQKELLKLSPALKK